MSNQLVDGFQGSQPFINDKEYKNLSVDEYEKEKLKKNYKDLSKKQKLIRDMKKLKRLNEKVEKGVDIKTFDEYFQECIKNTPPPHRYSFLSS